MDQDRDTQAPTPAPDDAPATQAGRNYAQASREPLPDTLASASIRESVREGLRQAKERAYAQDAVNASGKKIRPPGTFFEGLRWEGSHYVSDQPVRAALVAAAGGAVLTALLIAFVRGGRR
ncbi:hypothetical protein [Variovorax sp. OV329]|uniref:hypothetical protein n=1 Tax=Variovorax sp. OV329 TaxID=1882825 RepID=UPI0008EC40B8|nr:hypothetical protein [Variovorax sp. OV329]SFN10257.1 hypothetical protein SAMN05444747_11534 [Variovorax sp. OV329]